jgi:hypothetical protein
VNGPGRIIVCVIRRYDHRVGRDSHIVADAQLFGASVEYCEWVDRAVVANLDDSTPGEKHGVHPDLAAIADRKMAISPYPDPSRRRKLDSSAYSQAFAVSQTPQIGAGIPAKTLESRRGHF